VVLNRKGRKGRVQKNFYGLDSQMGKGKAIQNPPSKLGRHPKRERGISPRAPLREEESKSIKFVGGKSTHEKEKNGPWSKRGGGCSGSPGKPILVRHLRRTGKIKARGGGGSEEKGGRRQSK